MRRLVGALIVAITSVVFAQTPEVRLPSAQEFGQADTPTKTNVLSAIATGRLRVDKAQMSDVLIVALGDNDAAVRSAALQTVSGWYQLEPRRLLAGQRPYGGPLLSYDAEGAVLDGLDDPEPRVRRNAVQIALLCEEVRAGARHLRVPLAQRLSGMFDADASGVVRSEIIRQISLRAIDEPRASRQIVDALVLRALSDRDEFTLQFAIKATRMAAVLDLLPRLIDMVGHPSNVVRLAAADRMAMMPSSTTREYLGPLQRALDTEADANVKKSLAAVVEQVTSPPPLASRLVDSQAVKRLGQDPKHDERLQWFLDRMTLTQRAHSKVHDNYGRGWVLDDAVKDVTGFLTHDPLQEPVPQDGILESLVDLVCDSDVVVLGQLKPGVSNPTALGTYLFTDYDVQIVEALKQSDVLATKVGASVIVTRPGGELTVEGHPLKLWPPALPRLEPGRYVFFGEVVPDTKALQITSPTGVLAIEGANVRRLRSPEDPAPINRRDTVELVKVLTVIRAMKCR